MKDNPEGGELDLADDAASATRRILPTVSSCIDKRTKEDCDRGSKVGTVHGGRHGEGPVLLRKSKETGRRVSYEKDFIFR